jgi:hypothetical protein
MPRASAILRLVAFAVPAALGMAGIQPLLAAAAGAVHLSWALSLAGPALAAAALIFATGRVIDRGDAWQPPWYSAWVLLPGAFVLAGAAAMCIFGALVELRAIAWAMWTLLASGSVAWSGGLLLVRRASR